MLLVALLLSAGLWHNVRQTETTERERQRQGKAMLQLNSLLQQQQGVVQRILREQDPDSLVGLIARDSSLRARFHAAARGLGDQTFDSAFALLEQLDVEVVQLVLQGNAGQAQDQFLEGSGMLLSRILKLQSEFQDDWDARTQAQIADQGKHQKQIVFLVLLAVLAGGAVAWILGRNLTESIVSSLRETQRTMEDIAAGEGDLTRRLKVVSSDEIGLLSEAFNRFTERVHLTVRTVSGGVRTLGAAASEITDASHALEGEVGVIAQRGRDVADASREAGERVESATRSTVALSHGIARIAAAIEEMSATIREVSRSCQAESQLATQADRDMNTARANFNRLSTTSQEMNQLLESIQDISDQTQLLALNATIEASRAGEAGRGFAVVAAAVKDLAKQASRTGREIGLRVEAMSRDMKGAETSIESLEDVLRRVVGESTSVAAAVEEQEATIGELSRSISQTHHESGEIASQAQQASEVLAASVQEIEGLSVEIAGAARDVAQVRSSTTRLTDLSTELEALVSRFRI